MKQPPFKCTKPIVFTVVKNGERREVTIPAERAEEFMPIYGFAFSLMSGGGGEIRIK
jgi:hypothetical protein